jgi:hypothetical protein
MRRTLGAIANATGGTLIVVLLIATPAMAGQFKVATCQADRLGYTTSAFHGLATRGMQVLRACNPVGSGARGLITSNAFRPGTVPRGAASIAVIFAPPGTSFTRVDWAGVTARSDCGYTLQIYADSPGGRVTRISDDVRANRGCSGKTRSSTVKYQARGNSLRYEPRGTDISGATRIVQRIICEGAPRRAACSTRGANYVSTVHATIDVTDDQMPTATINPDTPLASGAWVSGSQPLHYEAQDNVGVKAAHAMIAGKEVGTDARPCQMATPEGAFADPVPCPNGPGQIRVDTHVLLEGTQQLIVDASDTADNVVSSGPVTVRIDHAPPARVDVSVDGGGDWRNRDDFALSWANPPEPDRAPIAAATYKLCSVGGGASCGQAEQTGDGIASFPVQVPAPGEWTLSMWRRDAAGNEDPNTASVPVTLRYDPEPPQLGFEPSSTDDPTLVSVQVTDKISGLAGGSIEIGPAGSSTWQTLATRKDGNRLVARIDDAALAAGDYVLRASAYDQAHNEASTTQRLDGQHMTLALPVRAASAMQVGVPRHRTVRETIQRHGRRRSVRRRVTVLRSATTAVFGRRIEITGRLTNWEGLGIPDAEVQVLSRSEASPEQLDARLHTDAAGRYRYTASGNASRVLRFVYLGSQRILPAQSEFRLEVPASSSFEASPRLVLDGHPVRFTGRVRTLPIPEGGKLVELQVRLRKRWQTFRTVRTDPAGHWALHYTFALAPELRRFHLRIRLPHEAGYPFGDGLSRVVHVQVRRQ